MDVALWIAGVIFLLGGLALALTRQRGVLASLPPFVPQLTMGIGAVSIIDAMITAG
jgi:hypothetical protein